MVYIQTVVRRVFRRRQRLVLHVGHVLTASLGIYQEHPRGADHATQL
jgi:hypothetical protein